MKVTQVAVRPTDASNDAGRPALTPELLAASGARYSRNNEGLDAILSKIDPTHLDKSVDSIFKMIDYGHQSIADMAPVVMFIDDISMWLAYYIWTLCPTAGGQESSTRYIKLSMDGLIDPNLLGIPEDNQQCWRDTMAQTFHAYTSALDTWESIVEANPLVAKIPSYLIEDTSEKSRKQVSRMRRNYAFDRSRYFLPVAAATNLMLVMSARGWVQLCQVLLSHQLPEPKLLGECIKSELQLSVPRLTRHAEAKESYMKGIDHSLKKLRASVDTDSFKQLHVSALSSEQLSTAHIEVSMPKDLSDTDLSADLAYHDNRYAYIGESLQRTSVRFAWDAVAMAEIRDLNRHRTGTKYCPLIPLGFYCAADQIPKDADAGLITELYRLASQGRSSLLNSRERLSLGDWSYIYWTLLGTQYRFEHVTTGDKFVYEVELRTGVGAHFRYAKHLRDVVEELKRDFPRLANSIRVGSAEPE